MLETAVRRATHGKRLVLAVSGGRDSMALLHAVARVAPRAVATVASFDHGTGPAAARATQLVASEAARLGFPAVIGCPESTLPETEAAWRAARLRFLSDVATRVGGAIVTAHTRDDQIETVLMRAMRDAGARGLAGLYAASDVLRPFLDICRDDVAAYVESVGARWIEDPTNSSMRFLRNRIRRDLLPALVRENPKLPSGLLAIARRAATWRERIDSLAERLGRVDETRDTATVPAQALDRPAPELAIIWPAIAARIGVTMDRRGTLRAAEFSAGATPGARMQLSGGWEIARGRDQFELRRAGSGAERRDAVVLGAGVAWNGWRFAATRQPLPPRDPWTAWLPALARVIVRPWRPGDRMRLESTGAPRKVKRFLSDAHVSGALRPHWPVVLVDDEIVWIPGIRRTDALAPRTGESGVVYRCELDAARR